MLLKELLPKSTFSDLTMQSSHMLVQTLALYHCLPVLRRNVMTLHPIFLYYWQIKLHCVHFKCPPPPRVSSSLQLVDVSIWGWWNSPIRLIYDPHHLQENVTLTARPRANIAKKAKRKGSAVWWMFEMDLTTNCGQDDIWWKAPQTPRFLSAAHSPCSFTLVGKVLLHLNIMSSWKTSLFLSTYFLPSRLWIKIQ